MKVYRYISGKCYSANAPDDAKAIYLGPQAERNSKITSIDWTRRFYKEELMVPFPEKWYNPDSLYWTLDEREDR